MTHKIPIFYRPEQSSPGSRSYSPSAAKPALAVEDWRQRFGDDVELHSFEPATREQLYAAHSKAHVDGVLDCRHENGFGNKSKAVADSLPYTTGSMIAAARHVLTYTGGVAVSPTSGFHHAGYGYGDGFCTFNGLMATAMAMKAEGLAQRVVILDFDQHYGDGTQDILNRLGLNWITHITAGKSYETGEEALCQSRFFHSLDSGPFNLALFQAGADIHINDPLGGRMTTKQMRQRDRSVFEACEKGGIPLVWNLAGGYQRDDDGTIEPVLALHRQTMAECIRVYGE